jgi:hypothetical protein
MKTTELFVEQVLIGIAVLFTGCLLVAPDRLRGLLDADFGEVALLAGGAYLLGMFFDRFADTLLQDTEQQHRLLRGLRAYYRQGGDLRTDPFPENRWRARLWFSTDAATAQATYLRSRMRLTRAVAVLLPALGVAVALELTEASMRTREVATLVVLTVYAAVFATKLRRATPLTAARLRAKPADAYALPRTGELVSREIRTWYQERIGGYDQARQCPTRSTFAVLLRGDAFLAVGVLLLAIACAVLPAPGSQRPVALAIAIGMPLLTAFAAWTWWRITETFFAFLQEHDQFAPAASGAGSGARTA